MRAVAVRTPGRPLVLSLGWTDGGIERLVGDTRGRLPDLAAVSGPPACAHAFASLWATRAGTQPALHSRQRIYALETVSPVPRPDGAIERAGAADHDLLDRWVDAFALETQGTSNPDTSRQMARERAPGGPAAALWLWRVGDRAVAMAGHSGPTRTGIPVAPVYTPPELRGRGYATALVADLSAHLLTTGYRRLFLFTDLANPTSNRIYQRVGYRPMADVHEYRLS